MSLPFSLPPTGGLLPFFPLPLGGVAEETELRLPTPDPLTPMPPAADEALVEFEELFCLLVAGIFGSLTPPPPGLSDFFTSLGFL